jgi:CubicO group peptidase (beta-lactamase class C family)
MKILKKISLVFVGLVLIFLLFSFHKPLNNFFCTKTLEEINVDIRNDKYGKISSLIIYQGPRILYEKYYGFSQPTTLHPISSVTKSITSIAVGICIDQGYIPSLDVKIQDYFPEFKEEFDKDPLKRMITLRHLLNQTSGLKWDEWDIHYSYAGNPLIELSHSNLNWCHYIINLPMDSIPGKKFSYNSGLSELIKEMVSRSTGVDFKHFVEENIFKKMKISTYHWDLYAQNGVPAWGGLSLCTRDMAKFGTLILYKGVWGNTRIVSEEWINLAISPMATADKVKYGLHWWIGDQPDGKPMIFAAGYGDQYIYIAPDKELVVAFNGQNFTDHKWDYNHDDLIMNILNAYYNN